MLGSGPAVLAGMMDAALVNGPRLCHHCEIFFDLEKFL